MSTICRYINLQELYFINSSTDQFTSYSYKNSNTAVSNTKCSYLAIHPYIFTILVYIFTKNTVGVYCYYLKFFEFLFSITIFKTVCRKIIIFNLFWIFLSCVLFLPHILATCFNVTWCKSADLLLNNFSFYMHALLYCYGLLMSQVWGRNWSSFNKHFHKSVLVVTGEI